MSPGLNRHCPKATRVPIHHPSLIRAPTPICNCMCPSQHYQVQHVSRGRRRRWPAACLLATLTTVLQPTYVLAYCLPPPAPPDGSYKLQQQADPRTDRHAPRSCKAFSFLGAPDLLPSPHPPPYPESPDDDDDDLREALGYFGWPSGGSILALVQVCTRSAGLLACLPARCQALTGRLAIRLALLPTDGRMTEV